ncbi:ATPase 3, plasma membrane-type-like isoform X2 [Oryza glaberrima]|uniref:ATPase 3, plasma membrane-type-like isoform X2 n=1 Tax=Oryza glaberrima TaxID=4538 RepID=UPI00224C09E7|nr:ATPase 3, plasma membrane-type-like isoform X2 [Oryza glaberrima]
MMRAVFGRRRWRRRRCCGGSARGRKEAARRLRLHGPNPNVVILSHHQEDSMLRKFLMKLFSLWEWNNIFPKYRNMICVILNSMSWVTVSSTVVSLTIASAGQRSSMMSITIYLLATSLTACLTVKLVVEYAKAPLEAKAYAPRAKVLRDGMWINVHAVNLVPGDIIFLKVGDIVPANARVLRFEKINTMTCWAKRSVDCVHGFLIYYAWTVSCGQGTAVVIATGRDIPRSTLRLYPQRYTRPGQLKEGIMLVGCFCFSLVLFGTIAEVILRLLFQKHSSGAMLQGGCFMALIGVVPMAMPVVLYLALAFGSLRLCLLGVASRGTVALEDLASMDVMLFNMTGTITCNKPSFARDKIELFAKGVNEDQAIVLASRASRSQHELYIEPIDPAILSLLDDPEQSDSCWEFAGLLPFKEDLRHDSADALNGLISLGLDIIVLTESPLLVTRQVCGRLGKLGINVLPARAVFELARNNKEVHLNINGISDLFPEDNSDIVRRLRNFGCRCAMVGHEFLDHDAIGESHIGISVADATDYTKSESDLVLTQPALIPISSAVQISREICQMMKGYMGCNNDRLLFSCGQCKIEHKSLMDTDEEIRAALFLQMSIVNQAVALFAYSDDCCHIRCPGPVVTFAFIFTQMVATRKAVGGDLDFAIAKGVGWLKAGLIWLYNFVLLLVPVDLSDMEACKDDWRKIVDEAFSHPTYNSALVTVHNT